MRIGICEVDIMDAQSPFISPCEEKDQHLCQCLRNEPLVRNHKFHVRKHGLPEACVLERVHVRMLGLGCEVDSDSGVNASGHG